MYIIYCMKKIGIIHDVIKVTYALKLVTMESCNKTSQFWVEKSRYVVRENKTFSLRFIFNMRVFKK